MTEVIVFLNSDEELNYIVDGIIPELENYEIYFFISSFF